MIGRPAARPAAMSSMLPGMAFQVPVAPITSAPARPKEPSGWQNPFCMSTISTAVFFVRSGRVVLSDMTVSLVDGEDGFDLGADAERQGGDTDR